MTDDDDMDERLRAALRAEDAELLARIDQDPGLRDVLRAGFRGRLAWMMFAAGGAQVALFAVAVWTAVSFYGAASVDDRVLWGVSMLLAVAAVGMLKLLMWNHAERAQLQLEMKRLRLEVATLAVRQRGDA